MPAIPPYYQDDSITLLHGDAATQLAASLDDHSVDTVVTSPPYYGLRDYGEQGQLGLEATPTAYVDRLVRGVFAQVARVLKPTGTVWLNLGDSYSGKANGGTAFDRNRGRGHRAGINPPQINTLDSAPYKSLLGIPWRVAFALQDEGWTIRNHIVWAKPNAMPESVTDRLSTRHESLFLLTRGPSYYFNLDPIREALLHPDKVGHTFGGNNTDVGRRRGGKYDPASKARPADGKQHTGGHTAGRNPGDVWTIPTQPFPGAHFATFPVALAERCVLAGSPPGGVVLDPFSGSGTTGLAATRNGRRYIGVDLSADYLDLSLRTRLAQTAMLEADA